MKKLLYIALAATLLSSCSSGPDMKDSTAVVNYLDAHKYTNADWGTMTFSGSTISASGHYDFTANFTLGDLNNAGERQIIINGDVSGSQYGFWRVDKSGDIFSSTGGTLTYYLKQ